MSTPGSSGLELLRTSWWVSAKDENVLCAWFALSLFLWNWYHRSWLQLCYSEVTAITIQLTMLLLNILLFPMVLSPFWLLLRRLILAASLAADPRCFVLASCCRLFVLLWRYIFLSSSSAVFQEFRWCVIRCNSSSIYVMPFLAFRPGREVRHKFFRKRGIAQFGVCYLFLWSFSDL